MRREQSTEGDERIVEDLVKGTFAQVGVLAVRGEIRATRLPRYAKWLQLERRLVSEVVGVGCEIHIPSVSLDVLSAFVGGFVEEKILLMKRRWRGRVPS
jgi:hypothetical protein